MAQYIEAIYDDGVLRPLQPLALPDQSRVKLTVEPGEFADSNRIVSASQKEALSALFADTDKLQTLNSDGWSARNHEELLYGKAQ
jgi:predicted DNA-binding antitoxin AbrB/MazE fold protein